MERIRHHNGDGWARIAHTAWTAWGRRCSTFLRFLHVCRVFEQSKFWKQHCRLNSEKVLVALDDRWFVVRRCSTSPKYVDQWGLTYIHTCRYYVHTPRADSSDFGLPGEEISQKFVIPCLWRRWTTEQNSTPLALSSAEKSVFVQTHTHKKTHTKHTNKQLYPHLDYRHM